MVVNEYKGDIFKEVDIPKRMEYYLLKYLDRNSLKYASSIKKDRILTFDDLVEVGGNSLKIFEFKFKVLNGILIFESLESSRTGSGLESKTTLFQKALMLKSSFESWGFISIDEVLILILFFLPFSLFSEFFYNDNE